MVCLCSYSQGSRNSTAMEAIRMKSAFLNFPAMDLLMDA